MYRLIVKRFGVLKNIDIELNKTNLFIGENGSGKSVLAKLITIITDKTLNETNYLKKFNEFQINFITNNTIIELYKNNEVVLKVNKSNIKILNYKSFESKYIPAERNLISLLNKSIFSLITSDIPLPKSLLTFASQYEKARENIKELDLLNIRFKNENGEDKIYYDDKNYLVLENSSSGIQTAVPLYITLKYFNNKNEDIIIEEPEQNLYPKSQVDTIKYIIENSSNNLYLMTHSPYVLTTLNILLFAHKVSSTNSILKDEISKIIPESQQINSEKFSAYCIKDGKSESIKSKRGLISENAIDEASDTIDNEFSELMELYRKYKND